MGTTVTAVAAWDADEWGGDSWLVDYRLESGNEDEVFALVTDRQTNEVSLVLAKVLLKTCISSIVYGRESFSDKIKKMHI